MKTLITTAKELKDYKELFYQLASRDIRARYKQSALGIGWVIIQPLAMMAIFTIVFSRIAKIDAGIPYPLFVFSGLLPWTYFTNTINRGSLSLISNINLITKIYLPREIFPISALFAAAFDALLASVMLLVLILVYHVSPSVFWLFIPLIVIVQTLFALGLVFILSSLNVFFRDINPITTLGMQIWLYLTPVIYPPSLVPEKYRLLINLNPMTGIITSYKNVLLFHKAPDPLFWYSAGVAILILIIGLKLFKRLAPSFADVI